MKRARASLFLQVALLAMSALTALAREDPATKVDAAKQSPHRASITETMDCSACHSESSWSVKAKSSRQSVFDHGGTGFPLTGRHRAADCVDCHRSDRAITRQCVGCHEDAHHRTLGLSCDGCHSATSWSSVSAIRLHRSTRLPLTGMHVLAACSECHLRASDNQFAGVPSDCYACHSGDYNRPDIHPLHRGVPGDPTRPALPKNCAGCHHTASFAPAFGPEQFQFRTSSEALRPLSHDAAFPLSFGKHRGVPCASCHLSKTATRFVICTSCHAHERARLLVQHRRVGAVTSGCLHCHPGGARR